MFIASKLEDVTPIFLETMVKKVCHSRLTHNQILNLEKIILQTLKFKLSSCPTGLEFIQGYLASPFFSKHP